MLKVHASTIRKTLNKNELFGRRMPCLCKKNMAAQLQFAKLYLNKPQDQSGDFWS